MPLLKENPLSYTKSYNIASTWKHILSGVSNHNDMTLWDEGICKTIEWTQGELLWYYFHWEVCNHNNIHYSLKYHHMVLSNICIGRKTTRQNIWTIQVGTPLMCRDISWSLTISFRISSSGSKPSNWSCLTSIWCGVWWWIFCSSIHEVRHNKPNWEGIVKRIPHRGAPDNIYIKNTWFNPNFEEDTRETPSRNPSVAPENNNEMIMSPQSK